MKIWSFKENLAEGEAASCMKKVLFVLMVFQFSKKRSQFCSVFKRLSLGFGAHPACRRAGKHVSLLLFGISAAFSGMSRIYDWFDEVKAGIAFLLAEHLSTQVYIALKNDIRLKQGLI